ncbi:MAG: dihydropteroate synthase [Pedosphaera sp.]|nr:dihydropteroate synthase [Pedosphaera sp.]
MLTLEYLAELAERHRADLQCEVAEFAIGQTKFDFNKTPYLMGVVNLSPDSWYRESVCLTADKAIERGLLLRAQGASIVDIGAESTLSNAQLIDVGEQQSRLLPVVRELAKAGVIVSVETYEPEVARRCLDAGAKVLNITGNAHIEELARMAGDHDAAMILCHVQGENVRQVGDYDFSKEAAGMLLESFERLVERAMSSGNRKLLIDPGQGFYYRNLGDSATRVRHQMEVFLNTFRLRRLGHPVCHALPHAFEYFGDEVRCAEPFFAVLAALGKTNLFRTHEVPRVRAVLETLGAY